MPKKSKNSNQEIVSEEIMLQREMLDLLRDAIKDLHEISCIEMSNTGVLPPFYAGEHLGEAREVLPLWALGDEPELGALLIRASPGLEPNKDLQEARKELDLVNDWPMSDLMDTLVDANGQPIVIGGEQYRDLSIIFPLLPIQVHPAPGYDRKTMYHFFAEMKPYAVFVRVPVHEKEDTVDYLWDEFERYHAEVVYADSPQLLEAAVWEYRLNFAMQSEVNAITIDGGNIEDEMGFKTTAELSAAYELDVMESIRVYGSTSPIRAKQEELDVLRDESGDLVVNLPLRPEVEPNPELAEERMLINEDSGTLLQIPADSDVMRKVWPEIRVHSYFSIRARRGQLQEGPRGTMTVAGFYERPMLEWIGAESIPDVYRITHLSSVCELLACCGMIKPKVKML